MAPVILYVVRHGESTDNLKSTWAGSRDAPLTTHGMNQAKALGASFGKSIRVRAIFASPLLRARWTAEQIVENQPTKEDGSKLDLKLDKILQEQHFGDAEGKSWADPKGTWARGEGRQWAFPNGESLDDVGQRADVAIERYLMDHIEEASKLPEDEDYTVVLVAHGIFNAELMGALLRRRKEGAGTGWRSTGMTNTGHHRVLLSLADHPPPYPLPPSAAIPAPHPQDTSPSSLPSEPAPTFTTADSSQGKKKLVVVVTAVNLTAHLEGVVRQEGGIGSAAHDERQSTLNDFFAGGGNTK